MSELYRLSIFVPESHLVAVKQACFEAGAGELGGYEQCAWETLGRGQFMPTQGSRPYIGESDQLSYVEEYELVIMVVPTVIVEVLEAMLAAHPYEVPAYGVTPLFTLNDFK